MPVVYIFDVPGAGPTHYDNVMARLGPEHPPGRLYHAAGPSEDGWRVVDVWESPEAFDAFLAEKLLPAARASNFFASLPQSFPAYNIVAAPGGGDA